MSGSENGSKEEIRLEQLPIKSNGSPQYYTSCEEGGERGEKRPDDTNNSLLEIDTEANLSANQATKWRYAVLVVSWLSIIILLIIGILSFVVSETTNSSAAFGFGFDCILDLFTSAVVLWRFMGSIGSIHSLEKERIALLFLGALFIIAAVSIFARTIADLISATETSDGYWLIVLAGVSVVVCSGLAISKFIIAKKLNSQSIKSDGYSSLAGAITSLSMLVSSIVISMDESVWYLDEIIGMVVGLLLIVYGIKLLLDVLLSAEMKVTLKSCLRSKKNTEGREQLTNNN